MVGKKKGRGWDGEGKWRRRGGGGGRGIRKWKGG